MEILSLLINDDSFDDIFNELSTYIYDVNLNLARKSVLIIGELGKKFKDRIRAIFALFINMFKMKKLDLYDAIFEALSSIFGAGLEQDGKE